jgi:hypothetical protein
MAGATVGKMTVAAHAFNMDEGLGHDCCYPIFSFLGLVVLLML